MDYSKSTRNLTNAQVGFIFAELRAGLALISIAEGGRRDAGQSRAHARAAYDCVLRFVNHVPLTNEEVKEVRSKLKILEKRLKSLGETV